MPINRITATKRGKAAIAAVLLTAAAGAWSAFPTSQPPAVVLATNVLIKGWEGLVLESHWDRYAKIWDICYGETHGITAGMKKTKVECDTMLKRRVYSDYYLPLTKRIPGYTGFPVSVQAALLSGAYNLGVQRIVTSTAVQLARQGKYREACEAQTAFNRAGGQVVEGLVKRREMGDLHRIGEAELCVSGL